MEAKNNILVEAENGQLGWQLYNNRPSPFSSDIGVGAYFSNEVRRRINHQMPCNVVFSGEPGISKSYSAIAVAKDIEPDFSEEQVIYTYNDYMDTLLHLKQGQIVVFDESEYPLGHRDWYMETNKCLVSSIRSSRFRVHPLFLVAINRSLLDKTLRKYLLQFQVFLDRRGEGQVFKISPSKFDDSVWDVPFCRLYVEMLDIGKCQKPWCGSCDDFGTCTLFRGRYERRRARIQMERYRADSEKGKRIESSEITMLQLEEYGLKVKDKWVWNTVRGRNKIDTTALQVALEAMFKVKLSYNKVLSLSRRLSDKYPKTSS